MSKEPVSLDKEHEGVSRKEEIEHFTKLVAGKTQPFVMSLNAPFGTGKTTFLKQWQKYLEAQNHPCILFNAWETDFADDALLAFVAELKKYFKQKDDSINLDEFIEKTSTIIKNNKKQLITAITSLVPVVGDLTEKLCAIKTQTPLKQQIEEFNSHSQAVKDFRESLKSLVAKLLKGKKEPKEEPKEEAKKAKNLIVFVDELDRCRPPYALQVLEAIKHFFEVSGLVFVIAVDDVQLRGSVQQIYGIREDGEGYLNKFIHLQVTLPELSRKDFIECLCQQPAYKDYGIFQDKDFQRIYILMARFQDLTLRQIIRGFEEIIHVVANSNKHPVLLMAFISTLRVNRHEVLKKLLEFEKTNPSSDNNNKPDDIIKPNDVVSRSIYNYDFLRKILIDQKKFDNYSVDLNLKGDRNRFASEWFELNRHLTQQIKYEGLDCCQLFEAAGRYLPSNQRYTPTPQLTG